MLFQKSLVLPTVERASPCTRGWGATTFFGWAAARFGVPPVGRSRFGDAYWRRGPEASRGLLRTRGGDRLPADGLPAILLGVSGLWLRVRRQATNCSRRRGACPARAFPGYSKARSFAAARAGRRRVSLENTCHTQRYCTPLTWRYGKAPLQTSLLDSWSLSRAAALQSSRHHTTSPLIPLSGLAPRPACAAVSRRAGRAASPRRAASRRTRRGRRPRRLA